MNNFIISIFLPNSCKDKEYCGRYKKKKSYTIILTRSFSTSTACYATNNQSDKNNQHKDNNQSEIYNPYGDNITKDQLRDFNKSIENRIEEVKSDREKKVDEVFCESLKCKTPEQVEKLRKDEIEGVHKKSSEVLTRLEGARNILDTDVDEDKDEDLNDLQLKAIDLCEKLMTEVQDSATQEIAEMNLELDNRIATIEAGDTSSEDEDAASKRGNSSNDGRSNNGGNNSGNGGMNSGGSDSNNGGDNSGSDFNNNKVMLILDIILTLLKLLTGDDDDNGNE